VEVTFGKLNNHHCSPSSANTFSTKKKRSDQKKNKKGKKSKTQGTSSNVKGTKQQMMS
jgi:hypothetical protein